jgi:hypothetical protein
MALRVSRATAQISGRGSVSLKTYTTLCGVTLLMTSNTLLLANLLLQLVHPELVKSNILLDPSVVGFSLDTMCTFVAMIIISGVPQKIFAAIAKKASSPTAQFQDRRISLV